MTKDELRERITEDLHDPLWIDPLWGDIVEFVATWIEKTTAGDRGVVGFARTLAEEWREEMSP